jgi:CRP-like cAMP-binding protein
MNPVAATEIINFELKKMYTAPFDSKNEDAKKSSPIGFIIQSLEIQLNRPEDVIIKQEDESTDMYFLARGDAHVTIKDRLGKEHFLRKLGPGAHFGEISLIFQTKRTATVISGNYSTFAKLSQEKFRELTQYIPELNSVIKKHITTYDDPVKRNVIQMFKRIEFLATDIPTSLITQLLYTTPSKQYDKG